MNELLTSLFGNVFYLICFIGVFILLLFFIRYKNRTFLAWIGIVLSFSLSVIAGSGFLYGLLSKSLFETGFIGFIVYILELILPLGAFYLLNRKIPKK